VKKIRIGNIEVGDFEETFIIAEAGINHDGKFIQAKKLVEEAAKIGAGAVKFQIFKAEEFCSEETEYFDLFKSLELKTDEWIELANLANDIGIIFTASVFGEESTDFLKEINVPVYKIASGDLTHLPLLKYIAKENVPIILSTGMSTIGEIDEAINSIYSVGNQDVTLMHCVSDYPTMYQDTNLNFIQTLKEAFKIPVGFSDHTEGILIPILAVSRGADIIEKHFTLDKNLPGPDHELSLEPNEFEKMIKNIRITESALRNGVKKLTEGEEESKKLARRSIIAIVDIPEGEIISKDNIRILRPEIGIEPKFIDLVIGKSVNKDIKKNQAITWDLIC
jgi:N-acetylneuraminate synthase/N,N'-diacetyllegionaminate synthase